MPHARQTRGRSLTYGLEESLLQTRGMLLQSDGYASDIVSNFEDLHARIASERKYDIVVLCHTVSEADHSALREELQARSNAVPVYRLTALALPREFLS